MILKDDRLNLPMVFEPSPAEHAFSADALTRMRIIPVNQSLRIRRVMWAERS